MKALKQLLFMISAINNHHHEISMNFKNHWGLKHRYGYLNK
jgi:hypothetical protein